MPCSCVPGCGCTSAAACAVSSCVGAGLTGVHLAAVPMFVGAYHGLWYGTPGGPNPEQERDIRQKIQARDAVMLERLRRKLRRVEAEAPKQLIRSEHCLEHEREKLQEHIRQLEHEISLLGT